MKKTETMNQPWKPAPPPIGLVPKEDWDRIRCEQIINVIVRYHKAKEELKPEWLTELLTLQEHWPADVQFGIQLSFFNPNPKSNSESSKDD